MTQINQVYKCPICGNMVEIIHAGAGELVCCGQPMQLLVANSVDAAKEKHVPVVTRDNGKIKVQIGSVLHPMETAHFIEWIEVSINDQNYRQYLKPGEQPQAEFNDLISGTLSVRAYCNLHGLWKA